MSSISEKMKDIETGVQNKIHAGNRTREQEICVENVVCFAGGQPGAYIDRYRYISKMFLAFEEATLKKHNIK